MTLYDRVVNYYSQYNKHSERDKVSCVSSHIPMITDQKYRYDWDTLPLPYLGNLLDARLYVLMLNPRPDHVQDYWRAPGKTEAQANLEQRSTHFYPLLDKNCPGHQRWTTFFRPIWSELSFLPDPKLWLSNRVCLINVLPYASWFFKDTDKIFDMPIHKDLREFVISLMSDPRRCFLIARKTGLWSPPETENVRVLRPPENRGVHLHKHVDWVMRYLSA